jgi:Fic family protein
MARFFSAQYQRFSPEASNLLMRIAAALATIRGATILPAVADQLRASARVGTIHYSNLIEGNELSALEAERAARGELDADSRAKIELVNYVAALDLIDHRLDAHELVPDAVFLKDLHATTMAGLGREDGHFKPRHEGEWRDGVAVVVNHVTGKVMHEGPPADEVPERMEAMFEWLATKLESGKEPIYVLAGVAHYGITEIHPFADGNGRAARLFQVALLMLGEVLPGRMFSFERYYAEDRPAYYAALGSVRRQTLNMDTWLEYFLIGLAEEYERVAAQVVQLSAWTSPGNGVPLQLTASQEAALARLRIEGRREFTRREYEQAGNVGRSTAGNDLRRLIEHGVISPRGSGSATRYAFTGTAGAPVRDGRGRPTKWTEARIERELRAFVDGRADWPSSGEFAAAGRGDLYAAASRNGGIRRWRRAVGL